MLIGYAVPLIHISRGLVATCIKMSVFFRHKLYAPYLRADEALCETLHKNSHMDIGDSVEWLVWTIIEPSTYILAASLPSYKILIVGGLLSWVQKLLLARGRNSRKAYGSGTTNDVRSNMGPFSKLHDNNSVDPGIISSGGAGYRVGEAFPRLMMDDGHEITIPLNTIQVKQEVDVNTTKGNR